MKTKSIFILLSLLTLFGCSSDDTLVPTQASIKGSLFVTVKDAAGKPVIGATIVIGDLTATTDEDGTYFFTQANLTGDDYLEVQKQGYFKGSRRFSTSESNTQFLRVTLLAQTEIGNFSSSQSATVNIDSKSKLTFPDHAVTRADGSAYNGNVHVLASPIYGDDPKLSEKMPGALVGLDQSNAKVALGSLGMLAVELQADNGDVLKIANGKTVEAQLKIANVQSGQAPATIPLWYFDEVQGLWIQEGEATRQGNTYVAQLPHFSFWNWDVEYTLVEWQTHLIFADGSPIQNAEVCLSVKSISSQACGRTDASGVLKGLIPANEAMELTVVNDCGKNVYTADIGPFSNDVNMGDIKLEVINSTDYADISGVALQCDGTPLTKGFVKVHTNISDFMFPIQDASGHYEGRYFYCNGDVVTVQVYDVVNSLTSLPRVITFERSLDLGGLKACDHLDEYIWYKIKGFSRDYVYYLPILTDNFNYIKIESLDSIGVKGRFGFTVPGVYPGQYYGYALSGNQINMQNGQVAYITSMEVNITEFGAVGGYVRGTMVGKINKGGNGTGGSGPSDFNGEFVVRRQ